MRVPLWLSLLVTVTLTDPAVLAGVVAVILVPLTTVTPVAAAPRLTVAPLRKPVPVTVMEEPPLVVPEAGEMPVTVGAGLDPV